MRIKRTLYSCMEARYPTDGEPSSLIYCRKGHKLRRATVWDVKRDKPLTSSACIGCPDFNDADEKE